MVDTRITTQNVQISVIGMVMNHIIHVGQFLGNGITVLQSFQVNLLRLQNPWISTLSPNISYLIDPCEEWPSNYFKKFDEPNETLVDELYTYGRHNLALIHLMIQSPYVTKIKRDVEITFLSFIADTGGLLGLCLGFSFISIIEIFFWICSCCRDFKKFWALSFFISKYNTYCTFESRFCKNWSCTKAHSTSYSRN